MNKSQISFIDGNSEYFCILEESKEANLNIWIFSFITNRKRFTLHTTRGEIRNFKSMMTGITFFMENCENASYLIIIPLGKEKWTLQKQNEDLEK